MIRILHAEPAADVEIANHDAGNVLFNDEEKAVVVCGNGLLRINAATDNEGRNTLPFKSFVHD